jgi:glutathione synthase/RimK-type ligase-like ATP-grasp enzyme
MILLAGIPSETPLEMVQDRLNRLSIPSILFHQRQFADVHLEFEIAGNGVTGWLRLPGCSYRLEDIRGVYLRLMDDRLLPELEGEPDNSPKRRQCRDLHDALLRWCEVAPGRVVNRIAPMGSNSSKPYQAQLIRGEGLRVPETLITTDPEAVLEFRRQHGPLIYKSISGVRSIVRTLEVADLDRLEHIRWCPTQFQRRVEGTDVRVHVVGDRVFATEIESQATDYRYSTLQTGRGAELKAVELWPELAEQCVRLAEAMGMAFVGIDLRITPEGEVYCFEVNPCPAYSYYEGHTDQPIAEAVARYLAG